MSIKMVEILCTQATTKSVKTIIFYQQSFIDIIFIKKVNHCYSTKKKKKLLLVSFVLQYLILF